MSLTWTSIKWYRSCQDREKAEYESCTAGACEGPSEDEHIRGVRDGADQGADLEECEGDEEDFLLIF
jgi:hypothetical protein